MSAIEALGIAAVGSALRGSTNAAASTERLEGRPGIRSGETDPASDVAREGVQQAIEDIVMAFTEAKLALADDSTAHNSSGASATPVVPVVIDAEARSRLADDDDDDAAGAGESLELRFGASR